ncbi:MAG: hypothetical protein MI921_10955, partial [Cytophagales bacterium]|nr:hypothetical protein [Cytophagales bacterium]
MNYIDQIKKLLKKFSDNALEKREFRQLMDQAGDLKGQEQKDKWLNAMDALEEEQEAKQAAPAQSDDFKSDFMKRLKARSNPQLPATAPKEYPKQKSYLWLKVAAGIAIVAVAVSIYMLSLPEGSAPQLVVHETLQGQKSKITLPD